MISTARRLLIMACMLCLSGPALAQEKAPPFKHYEIIEKRNFFRPKIEPVTGTDTEKTPDGTADTKVHPEATDLVLTGIVFIRGKHKAIVEKTGSGKSFYVKVNDTFEDYTVEDIRNNRMVLKKGDVSYQLTLRESGTQTPSGRTESKTTPAKDTSTKDHGGETGNMIQRLRTGTGKGAKK